MRGRSLRLSMAVLTAALAAAMALLIGACGGDDGGGGDASQEPLKIGVIVSLSGPYAGLGQPEKNTLEMELKDLNDDGGVNGRQVELIFEDDATDEAKAVSAASKLIEQDQVVAIIGPTGTGQTMAIRGDIDRAQIPQVSMAGGTVITNPVDEWVFATPWPNTIVVPFTLDRLTSEGITKIGLIYDSGGFGKDGQAVLAAEAPKAGIEVVDEEQFNPGDTDMTAQLTKISKSGAEAIVMWTAGAEAAIIAKEVKDLGIELPLYGSHGIARKEFIDGAGDAAEGVQFAAGKVLVPEAYGEGTEAYTVATDFIAQYEATYGEPPSTFAGHAYDAFWIVVNAAKAAGDDLTPATLRDQIEQTTDFIGIGGTFSYSPEDHNGMTADDLTMYEISGGGWTLAE